MRPPGPACRKEGRTGTRQATTMDQFIMRIYNELHMSAMSSREVRNRLSHLRSPGRIQ